MLDRIHILDVFNRFHRRKSRRRTGKSIVLLSQALLGKVLEDLLLIADRTNKLIGVQTIAIQYVRGEQFLSVASIREMRDDCSGSDQHRHVKQSRQDLGHYSFVAVFTVLGK